MTELKERCIQSIFIKYILLSLQPHLHLRALDLYSTEAHYISNVFPTEQDHSKPNQTPFMSLSQEKK